MVNKKSSIKQILKQIRECDLCQQELPHVPRPIVQASAQSRILIIGQAQGRKVHESGVPWDDASGDRLRDWVGVTKTQFYDPTSFAIMPMGFCFPGSHNKTTGQSGDLPPMKICAPTWHQQLMFEMPEIKLTLVIGQYAMKHHLDNHHKNLTQTVKNFKEYLPQQFVLPHPSPRNNIWMKKNPWFQDEVLPQLKHSITQVLK
ncbi:uracil-DNA glycosylase family protein [Marinicella rhabdoformis]|uniref:uracil-DNA glycosylase family protein n=1 Tax=Marinicella rhabdoformis TaxID=2580566 RepID=UPI0012AEB8B5|nr:uracil-DNA glycosylase family protein [Marinicella rhabdoformis]